MGNSTAARFRITDLVTEFQANLLPKKGGLIDSAFKCGPREDGTVKALWVFLCLPMAAMPAPAQQAQPLTLPQALELADRQNLDLAAARAQRAVALAGVRIAGEWPN